MNDVAINAAPDVNTRSHQDDYELLYALGLKVNGSGIALWRFPVSLEMVCKIKKITLPDNEGPVNNQENHYLEEIEHTIYVENTSDFDNARHHH